MYQWFLSALISYPKWTASSSTFLFSVCVFLSPFTSFEPPVEDNPPFFIGRAVLPKGRSPSNWGRDSPNVMTLGNFTHLFPFLIFPSLSLKNPSLVFVPILGLILFLCHRIVIILRNHLIMWNSKNINNYIDHVKSNILKYKLPNKLTCNWHCYWFVYSFVVDNCTHQI